MMARRLVASVPGWRWMRFSLESERFSSDREAIPKRVCAAEMLGRRAETLGGVREMGSGRFDPVKFEELVSEFRIGCRRGGGFFDGGRRMGLNDCVAVGLGHEDHAAGEPFGVGKAGFGSVVVLPVAPLGLGIGIESESCFGGRESSVGKGSGGNLLCGGIAGEGGAEEGCGDDCERGIGLESVGPGAGCAREVATDVGGRVEDRLGEVARCAEELVAGLEAL